MTETIEPLSAEERDAILNEVSRLHAEPTPVNTSSVGCVTFLFAFALFFAAPSVIRHATWLRLPFLIVEAVLVLLGAYWYFRGSGGAFGKATIAAQEAIETIRTSWPPHGNVECAKAAARLIAVAYYSDGPSMSTTFNFESARKQLGPALPFVISVEKFLIAEHKASPVFTLKEASGESAVSS